jgi:hypothetical protein
VAIASHTPRQGWGKARRKGHYKIGDQEGSQENGKKSHQEGIEESASVALLRKQDCPL